MKMRIVFDKEYKIESGKYCIKIREISFDEELKKVLEGRDPGIRLNNQKEIKLSELKELNFEFPSREQAERGMSEIKGAIIESISALIARFKEAQQFNGSVVHEIDFNQL
ncbi:hypothetical protein [Thermococcus barophilus]|uniref:Uncharacterized protein n=1 Tax=Thermococcus barophilus TaxID=55802 RepID=A0A0S1XEH7_THEBA|nr:hypothetical protein [Thermococcus barophilus]ALM76130.1 hypothetical protein TBCH5v1_2233 [Thermococcus barophilus]